MMEVDWPTLRFRKDEGMKHRKFDYASPEDFRADLAAMELDLPWADGVESLAAPLEAGGLSIPNRLAAQPIEGFDSLPGGAPSPRTRQRYQALAQGGSGLIWMESVSVDAAGRSNPTQLWLNEETLPAFTQLVQELKSCCNPPACLVIQLTHSGRFSAPEGVPAPLCAVDNLLIPKDGARVITDQEVEELEDAYVHTALLAQQAGFDGVDIRACHGYLLNEFLGAFQRPGPYGGSFENRTRFLLNVIDKIRARCTIPLTVRLNFCDGLPAPWNWGATPDGAQVDLAEPLALIGLLRDRGVTLINLSAGIGAYCPQLIRPSDSGGEAMTREHPMEGVARMLQAARQVKETYPDLTVLASAFTWMRQFGPHVAAGGIKTGWFDLAGFGRETIYYPPYARDILSQGGVAPQHWCTTCNACMALIKQKQPMRCVARLEGRDTP